MKSFIFLNNNKITLILDYHYNTIQSLNKISFCIIKYILTFIGGDLFIINYIFILIIKDNFLIKINLLF